LTQQALDQLINEKAQLQQARDNGIRIDDAEVDQTEFNDDSDSETELSESETSSSDDYHFIPDPTEDSDTEYNFESEIINSYDANI
jgi:parvulin-like peptidyl-prolyl isomerase